MALELKAVDYSDYDLARIEREALSAMRDLAQRHLLSMRALTASAVDPGSLITSEMEAEYVTLALALWEQVNDLSTGFGLDLLPLDSFWPLVKDAVERSARTYNDILKLLIEKQADVGPLYGEFFLVPDYVPGTGLKPPAPYTVQFGDIRRILGELGGGAPAEVPLSTGITGGTVFNEVLAANGIPAKEKLWLYGETVRRTFNGHLQIDGLVFSEWDDPALDIAPQDRWLKTDKYRPGDHWGCACVIVPYVPNFGVPIPMTITASLVISALEEFYTPTQPRDRGGRWTVGGGSASGLSEGDWQAHRGTLTSLDQQRLDRAFGRGAEGIFGTGQGLTTTTPWPRAPRRKGEVLYQEGPIREALARPILESVDPRMLYATQPNLVRAHFDYYMGETYRQTGRTSADQASTVNAFPVVWVNKRGERLIVSGHHRAAAALAKGESLPAIVVREP